MKLFSLIILFCEIIVSIHSLYGNKYGDVNNYPYISRVLAYFDANPNGHMKRSVTFPEVRIAFFLKNPPFSIICFFSCDFSRAQRD